MEIVEKFSSFRQFYEWFHSAQDINSTSSISRLAQRITENGISEPLTGRFFPTKDIVSLNQNWREGLVTCGINARMRAVLFLINEITCNSSPYTLTMFATEAITPFSMVLKSIFPRLICSEYGADEAARQALFPIPHQDLMGLTLPNDSFDLVTTNEVIEHVPDIDRALVEVARVLKPGGWHVGTFPFRYLDNASDLRTKIVDGQVVHLREPEWHGNPVDPSGGSLVFETPGWDIVDRALSAGFSEAHMRWIMSERHGILGADTGIFVFCAQK